MTSTGDLSSVEARTLGSPLVADAAVGDTVLFLDMVSDFDEAGGLLLLNGQKLAYTSVDPVLETVTLAAPLTVAAATDDRADVVQGGVVAVEWIANVAVDDGDPVPATIPTALIAYFPEGSPESATSVEIEQHAPGSFRVTTTPDQAPPLDGAAVWNPYVARRMDTASITTGVWTAPTAWADEVSQGLTANAADVVVQTPGLYDMKANPGFVTNGTGLRYARILVNGVQVGYNGVNADSSATTFVNVFATVVLFEGDVVSVEVMQSSGVSLALSVGAGRCPFSMYRVSV